MKKQILALSALLTIGLTSCEKDDPTGPVGPKPKNRVEILTDGSWDANSMRVISTVNGTILYDSTESISGKATFLANKQMIAEMPGEPNDTMTWALNGDTLALDTMKLFILDLSDKNFEIEHTEEEFYPGYGTVKIQMRTNFKR